MNIITEQKTNYEYSFKEAGESLAQGTILAITDVPRNSVGEVGRHVMVTRNTQHPLITLETGQLWGNDYELEYRFRRVESIAIKTQK